MPLYKEAYPKGSRIRIASRATLKEFRRNWKHHHRLKWWQLWYADRVTVVTRVSYYHGGDTLYSLGNVPGIWHESCLLPADT